MGDDIFTGPILSPVGGRTDKHHITVPANSYVVPADVVSAVPGAEGNTLAGHKVLEQMFNKGPYGSAASGPYGTKKRAGGGLVQKEGVDIIAAGGEYVIPPEAVAKLGDGDIKRGHAILDAFVKKIRSENVKTLKKLPGPARK